MNGCQFANDYVGRAEEKVIVVGCCGGSTLWTTLAEADDARLLRAANPVDRDVQNAVRTDTTLVCHWPGDLSTSYTGTHAQLLHRAFAKCGAPPKNC